MVMVSPSLKGNNLNPCAKKQDPIGSMYGICTYMKTIKKTAIHVGKYII